MIEKYIEKAQDVLARTKLLTSDKTVNSQLVVQLALAMVILEKDFGE